MSGLPNCDIPLFRKLVFSAIACLLFFAFVECLLWAFGVKTIIAQQDPSAGFSGLVSVFVKEGDQYRTRPSLGSTFNDQAFSVVKAPGTKRIFVLGGSSAHGFPWNAEVAFSGVLHDVLSEAHPNTEFEVVNAAGVSYAMHRLNLVVDEIVNYDPDVFVIYSGHNEFVERDFYDALKGRGAARNRLEFVLAQTRLYSVLSKALATARDTSSSGRDEFGMSVRREEAQKFAEHEKQKVVDDFRRGLRRLIRHAQEKNIYVILATVPCNLREWSPRESVASLSGAEVERAAWAAALSDGRRRLDNGQFREAVTALKQAASIAPQHAETHFLLAQAHEGSESWELARASYERACDCDPSPSRRHSGINDAIRTVAREEKVTLLDFDKIFHDESDHGLIGFNLIEDYVHPNKIGHQLIAWHLWKSLLDEGWLGEKQSADRELFDRVVKSRKTSSETGNASWHFNQAVVLENQGFADRAIEKYRRAVELAPEYPAALQNLAFLLFDQGRYKDAAKYVDQLLRVDRDHPGGNMLIGDLLVERRQLDEAIRAYQQAIDAMSSPVAPLNRLGIALSKKGDLEQAVTVLNRALKLDPENAAILLNLGSVHYLRKDWGKAAEQYQKVLRLQPDNATALFNLGLVHSKQQQWQEAEKWFERALQANPDFTLARQSLDQLRQALRNEERRKHSQPN